MKQFCWNLTAYDIEVQPPVQTDLDVSHVDAQPFNSHRMAAPFIKTSAFRIFDRRDVHASC